MTPCASVFLVGALAGLPPGTCTLQCLVVDAIVAATSIDGHRGTAMRLDGPAGKWFEVHRVDGRWTIVLQQEGEQCLEGGVQW